MTINDEIEKLESLYKKLMTEDNTPDEEAQAKMEYLEIISNIEAMIGNMDKDLENEMESVKEALLSWDPYGPWFKEQRNLVKGVYKLIISIKKHKFTSIAGEDKEYGDIRSEVKVIRNEFDSKFKKIDEDIRNIKKSIKIIVENIQYKLKPKEKIEAMGGFQKNTKGGPTPVPISSPISEKNDEKTKDMKKIRPKTRFKSIPIPSKPSEVPQRGGGGDRSKTKPASIEPIQAPINLEGDEESLSVEIDPAQLKISVEGVDDDEPKMENILSNKQAPVKEKTDKDKLFNILTGRDSLEEIKAPEPEIKRQETSEESLFKVLSASGDQPSETVSKPVTIYSENLEDEEEVIEFEVEEEEEETEIAEVSSLGEEVDPETLYQELINLEGKRYSLERSIRDLKRDRESGKISDNEYKSKLNKLVQDLQSISKRIEQIRDHLD